MIQDTVLASPISVLLVEDSPEDAELTELTLGRDAPHIHFDTVHTARACHERLAQNRYDAIVLDYKLPDSDGLELLQAIVAGQYPAPVVVVTGWGDERVAVKAMKTGAFDYVVKDRGYLVRLPEVIRSALKQYQLQQEKEQLNRKLEVLYEQERAARAELELLHSVAQIGLSTLDLEEMTHALISQMVVATGADAGSILLRDRDTNELVVRASYGLEEDVEGRFRVPWGQGLAGRVAAEERTMAVVNVPEAHWILSPYFREKGIQSVLATPLLTAHGVIGVAHIDTVTPREFVPDEVLLFERLAGRAAMAIDNAWLHTQTVRHLETQELLLQEIQHRVRNNLQGIVGLLTIQKNYASPDVRQIIDSVLGRIKHMAALQDFLAYRGSDPIPLRSLLDTLATQVAGEMSGGQAPEIRVEPEMMVIPAERARVLSLIVHELLVNAYKHSGEHDESVVKISATSQRGVLALDIVNRGNLPADLSGQKGSGVGLPLARSLLSREFGGRLDLFAPEPGLVVARVAMPAPAQR